MQNIFSVTGNHFEHLFSSVMSNSLWPPWNSAHRASCSNTNSRRLHQLMSFESVMHSNHPIHCHPLLLPSIFPSIRVFSNKSAHRIRWPMYWSFNFSISSNEYSGLISFRTDQLDLPAVQGTLKSFLQHHNSKASILGVQLSLWSKSTSTDDYCNNHSFDYEDFCW